MKILDIIGSIFGKKTPKQPKQQPKIRRKVYRLRYPERKIKEEQEEIGEREEKETGREEVKKAKGKPKRKSKSKNKEKSKKEGVEGIEDVDKAIELIYQAAKHLACPFCRARLVDEIEYLLTYNYKTKLVESGIDPDEVDDVFNERYAKIVKKKVEKIKKDLNIGDFELKQAAKEKAKAILS